MLAVEKLKEDELFKVESEYTSAAVKTVVEEISLQSESRARIFPYSLCTSECMLCLSPVYSTNEKRKNVGIIPSSSML